MQRNILIYYHFLGNCNIYFNIDLIHLRIYLAIANKICNIL